jgi:hypothetical protein
MQAFGSKANTMPGSTLYVAPLSEAPIAFSIRESRPYTAKVYRPTFLTPDCLEESCHAFSYNEQNASRR